MRVLILHNRYSNPGGEDAVVRSEAALLESSGVEVRVEQFENPDPESASFYDRVRAGLAAAWSRDAASRVAGLCGQFRPDIVHVHNFWMALSPSVHAACRRSGAATVQTLHNLRLLCLHPCCIRGGRQCEECLKSWPWRGVWHRCYRNSAFSSAALAWMVVANRIRRTWHRDVDAFIALTEYSRRQFAQTFPPARLFTKPNFVEDPGPVVRPPSAGNVVLYAGRLSAEKGVDLLLSAWRAADLDGLAQLQIVGDGPLDANLRQHAGLLGLRPPAVTFAGRSSGPEVLRAMSRARAVVVPSGCEQFPRVVAESYACGRPVIASDSGCMAELVHHNEQGLNFSTGRTGELAAALRRIVFEPSLSDGLGRNARATYLRQYTPGRNIATLMEIYDFARRSRIAGTQDFDRNRSHVPTTS